MKSLYIFSLLIFIHSICSLKIIERNTFKTENIIQKLEIENEQPIIGILTQEMSYSLNQSYPGMHKSYIAASYVKFLEGAGARVIPIWIGKNEEYYEEVLSHINGVLFPGGATWFNQTDGYADAGEIIYKIAKKYNDQGDYFPLWGTCLGFELLTYLSANRKEHRADCSSNKQSIPLDFKNDFRTSKMFKNAPEEVITILSKEAVTSNFHQFCVTEANLTNYNLNTEWRVLSVNDDFNGLNFISAIESKNYPFYGIQFHPEKNIYEWVENKNIAHSRNAITANRYFGDFFINETRQNKHRFENIYEERLYLIYNYPTTYTALSGSAFEQCYFFSQ